MREKREIRNNDYLTNVRILQIKHQFLLKQISSVLTTYGDTDLLYITDNLFKKRIKLFLKDQLKYGRKNLITLTVVINNDIVFKYYIVKKISAFEKFIPEYHFNAYGSIYNTLVSLFQSPLLSDKA